MDEERKEMDEDCKQWILANLREYYELLDANDFTTLESLAIVNNDDLKDMGVTSVGIRKNILSQLLKLNTPQTSRPKPLPKQLYQKSK